MDPLARIAIFLWSVIVYCPITGCQVVLGANWLSTLGDITWNFKNLTMKFVDRGLEHRFEGIQVSTDSLLEPKDKDLILMYS